MVSTPTTPGGDGRSMPLIPDPSEQTQKAVDQLRKELVELFDSKLEAVKLVIEERLAGIDRATELRLKDLPTIVDEKVNHLEQLHNEKFSSINTQFAERDVRSERESRDNDVRVVAAFAAQKESAAKQDESNQKAIDKSERATAETLNKQADLFKSTTDAIVDQLTDLKVRVNGSEQNKVGGQESKAASVTTIGVIATIIGAILGLLAFNAIQNDPAPVDPVIVEIPAP